jgi:two-component system NtrC family response regulator
MKQHIILFADDDASQREVAAYRLEQAGYTAITAADGAQALDLFSRHTPSAVITDLRMPGMHGLDLLAQIKSLSPDTAVIVVTAHGSIDSAVEAMKRGAFDYLQKPFSSEQLILCVEKALRVADIVQENRYLRQVVADKFRFESMIGTSPGMEAVFRTAAQVAPRDATVLLLGQSGTGKELLAKAIHFQSARRDKPFVAVNMAAVPETLAASELFGHAKGAFTGAIADKPGRFEQAHRGTLFLDEIADLRPELQGHLLRVLQEKTVERVGENKARAVDVRIIAATNQDLEEKAREGEFREDLFYRLNVVPITLPPLRERTGDIPLLLDHFNKKISAGSGAPPLRFSDHALRALSAYSWPGNVRELENLVERLSAVTETGIVDIADLPESLRRPGGASARLFVDLPDDGISLYDIEKAAIERALEKNSGNQSRTARFLNIPRNTLLYRMDKLGIPRK